MMFPFSIIVNKFLRFSACKITQVGKGNNLSSNKSLQFENHQKEDLPRAVHVNALSICKVDDLDRSQGATMKIIISYPRREVKSINEIGAESQSVVKNIGLKNSLQRMSSRRISCPRVKRSVYRWNRATVQKFHEDWQLFEGEQPRSVGSFFYQNALQGTGHVLCTFVQSALLFGSNSEEATERAVNAAALAFSSLLRCRNLKMALLLCTPFAFLSGLKLPFPFLSNACHAG